MVLEKFHPKTLEAALSTVFRHNIQPEVDSDVISSVVVNSTAMMVRARSGWTVFEIYSCPKCVVNKTPAYAGHHIAAKHLKAFCRKIHIVVVYGLRNPLYWLYASEPARIVYIMWYTRNYAQWRFCLRSRPTSLVVRCAPSQSERLLCFKQLYDLESPNNTSTSIPT